jgi:hypothetical protein
MTPVNEKPSTPPSIRGPRSEKLSVGYDRRRSFASVYPHLLLKRYATGLLEPFRCNGCGVHSLDPIGSNGRNQSLCESCADGGN